MLDGLTRRMKSFLLEQSNTGIFIVIALQNSVVVVEINRSHNVVGAAFSSELEVGEPSPSGVAGRILVCVGYTSHGGLALIGLFFQTGARD